MLQVAQFVAAGSVGCLGLSNAMSDMHVEAPPGNIIGGVHQDYIFAFQQWFSVVNAEGQTMLKITKSMGNFFSPEVDFKVYTGIILCQYSVYDYENYYCMWFGKPELFVIEEHNIIMIV